MYSCTRSIRGQNNVVSKSRFKAQIASFNHRARAHRSIWSRISIWHTSAGWRSRDDGRKRTKPPKKDAPSLNSRGKIPAQKNKARCTIKSLSRSLRTRTSPTLESEAGTRRFYFAGLQLFSVRSHLVDFDGDPRSRKTLSRQTMIGNVDVNDHEKRVRLFYWDAYTKEFDELGANAHSPRSRAIPQVSPRCLSALLRGQITSDSWR